MATISGIAFVFVFVSGAALLVYSAEKRKGSSSPPESPERCSGRLHDRCKLSIEDVVLTVAPIRKGAPEIGIGNAIGSIVFSVTGKLEAHHAARTENRTLHRWGGGAREFGVGVGIMSRTTPAVWVWSRVAGDLVDLSALGAVLANSRRPKSRRNATIATAAVAGVTVADVVTALRLVR